VKEQTASENTETEKKKVSLGKELLSQSETTKNTKTQALNEAIKSLVCNKDAS
jgi:hypothetical protein